MLSHFEDHFQKLLTVFRCKMSQLEGNILLTSLNVASAKKTKNENTVTHLFSLRLLLLSATICVESTHLKLINSLSSYLCSCSQGC